MEPIDFFVSIKTPTTIVHVLSVVLGMGGALISDMFFSIFSRDKKLDEKEISTLSILSKVVLYSLILIFISGVFLFLANPERYIESAKFLAKMSIVFILLINGYLLNKIVWPYVVSGEFFTSEKLRSIRRLAFSCGAVSVVSWLSVLVLGVLNRLDMSFVSIMAIYLVILLIGIACALFVEKKELN